jgi:hypothetical protein
MNIQDFCKIQIRIHKIKQSSRTNYQNLNVVANVDIDIDVALIEAAAAAADDDDDDVVVEAAVDRCL